LCRLPTYQYHIVGVRVPNTRNQLSLWFRLCVPCITGLSVTGGPRSLRRFHREASLAVLEMGCARAPIARIGFRRVERSESQPLALRVPPVLPFWFCINPVFIRLPRRFEIDIHGLNFLGRVMSRKPRLECSRLPQTCMARVSRSFDERQTKVLGAGGAV
jgi:hypothetical protein